MEFVHRYVEPVIFRYHRKTGKRSGIWGLKRNSSVFKSSLYEPRITPQIVKLKGNVLKTVKIQHRSIISVLTTLIRL